jgi:hypothetical protein
LLPRSGTGFRLAEHCPDRHLQLCVYRTPMPADADDFFWSGDRVHRPIALASMGLLAIVAFAARRRKPFFTVATLAATTLLALVGNAVVCGVFANPHDRYGARLVWLAPLAVAFTLCRIFAERGRPRVGALVAAPIPPG